MRPFEKIYVKDFDGNILTTPTVYYFEEKQPDGSWKEIEVLAHDHDSNPNKYLKDKKKYRFINNDKDSTYQNCMDYFHDPRHKWPTTLSQDIIQAFEQGNFAPSFPKFRDEVLVNAELFAIFTARNHSPDTLKVNMQCISDLALTVEQKEQQIENIKKKFGWGKKSNAIALNDYFNINAYLPVNNIEVAKFFGIDSTMSTAQRKVEVMDWYLEYLMSIVMQYQHVDEKHKVKLWFSDDGIDNIEHMAVEFARICHYRSKRPKAESPYDFIDYRLYYTSDKEIDKFTSMLTKIEKSYNNATLYAEDKSYFDHRGILLPVRKISFK